MNRGNGPDCCPENDNRPPARDLWCGKNPARSKVCCLEGTRTPNLLIRSRNLACSLRFVSYQIMPLSSMFIALREPDNTSQHRDVSDGLIHFRYAFKVVTNVRCLAIFVSDRGRG